jgi:hypothetical protein
MLALFFWKWIFDNDNSICQSCISAAHNSIRLVWETCHDTVFELRAIHLFGSVAPVLTARARADYGAGTGGVDADGDFVGHGMPFRGWRGSVPLGC